MDVNVIDREGLYMRQNDRKSKAAMTGKDVVSLEIMQCDRAPKAQYITLALKRQPNAVHFDNTSALLGQIIRLGATLSCRLFCDAPCWYSMPFGLRRRCSSISGAQDSWYDSKLAKHCHLPIKLLPCLCMIRGGDTGMYDHEWSWRVVICHTFTDCQVNVRGKPFGCRGSWSEKSGGILFD